MVKQEIEKFNAKVAAKILTGLNCDRTWPL